MGKAITASGVAAVGFLAVGLGGPTVIEGMPSTVSYALTAVGAVMLLTVFLWTLLNKGGGDQETTTTQASHGHQSPNYGRVEGGVHNYYAPAPVATQPRKSPHGEAATSPWDDPSFSLLNRHSAPQPTKRPVGDMPLKHVLERLWPQIEKHGKTVQQIDREITNAFADGIANYALAVWGRREDGQPVEPVWQSALKRGKFSYRNDEITYRDPDNPSAVHRWYDLKFNRDQVDEWLPPSWKAL